MGIKGNPQMENGYTRLANELLEALCRTNLSPYEWRILHALVRLTYGFQKKADCISLSQFTRITGLDRRLIHRALKSLLRRRIIARDEDLNYGVNKHYTDWVGKGRLEKQPRSELGVVKEWKEAGISWFVEKDGDGDLVLCGWDDRGGDLVYCQSLDELLNSEDTLPNYWEAAGAEILPEERERLKWESAERHASLQTFRDRVMAHLGMAIKTECRPNNCLILQEAIKEGVKYEFFYCPACCRGTYQGVISRDDRVSSVEMTGCHQ